MRIMVLGDIHGNTRWLSEFVYPAAYGSQVDRIVQVGDFGFWEHMKAGVEFCDLVALMAARTGIPMYWLHGNHDKHSLALRTYGQDRDPEGFVRIRGDHLLYVPQGHLWEWAGARFRSFGGAYSVDKQWRLDMERKTANQHRAKEGYRRAAGRPTKAVPSTAGTLWFPEEEMSDEQMDKLLAEDDSHLDIVLSHDKPRGSNPNWNRKDLLECLPNQDRLQRALLAHRPQYWFHGHLHHFYRETVRSGSDSGTTVVGLDCDSAAAGLTWRREHTYAIVDLRVGVRPRVLIDREAELVDQHKRNNMVAALSINRLLKLDEPELEDPVEADEGF